MTKAILIIAVSLVSASFSHAAYTDTNAKRICDDLSSNIASVECNRAIEGEAISLGVIKLCGQLSFGTYVAECFKVGAGNDYSDAVLNYCSAKADEYDRITCLKTATGNARKLPKPTPACIQVVSTHSLEGLQERAENIYNSVNGGNKAKALEQLEDLYNRIEDLKKKLKN
ncbi:hypothetical protein DOM22_03260 [Bdellovibrio sp. ZAP7]|uniref:hypothetical protein n=1 Tax=Bdellovibrio sp. ZAP7 TaxID=2231053 RepID=UPI001158F4CE|nr:hypothetical protein [Bdellovibrio sp. ZAP7]QDK44241.1 hypothetical protein DOM22_03260 [Bdellovibrio sp. ZAP7]